MAAPAILVHGGVGNDMEVEEACRAAVQAGMAQLRGEGDVMSAAIAAVVVLENDGRLNAGSGAALSLDGATVEMDACVMDTRGTLGTVACVKGVKNPVLLAREVSKSPHVQLVGEGAFRFAQRCGFEEYYNITGKARSEHAEILVELRSDKCASAGVDNREFSRLWNYPAPVVATAKSQQTIKHSRSCDTVGAVARDAAGHFAVAGSTGGAPPSLMGRVGDTAQVGSGFYCGPLGAIAATGIGEHIVRHLLARTVYQWLVDGMPLRQALQRGIDLFDPAVAVGLIGITADDLACRANQETPIASYPPQPR